MFCKEDTIATTKEYFSTLFPSTPTFQLSSEKKKQLDTLVSLKRQCGKPLPNIREDAMDLLISFNVRSEDIEDVLTRMGLGVTSQEVAGTSNPSPPLPLPPPSQTPPPSNEKIGES
jgi:hypothetical protein